MHLGHRDHLSSGIKKLINTGLLNDVCELLPTILQLSLLATLVQVMTS